MIYIIAFLDTLSVVGLVVSAWLLRYSLLKDRRYYTVDNTKFYVENRARPKYILSVVVCLSWVIASFGVAS